MRQATNKKRMLFLTCYVGVCYVDVGVPLSIASVYRCDHRGAIGFLLLELPVPMPLITSIPDDIGLRYIDINMCYSDPGRH